MATRGKRDGDGEDARPPVGEEASTPRRGRTGDVAATDPHAALLAGLDAFAPGLEILDRELLFEGGARADVAAVDSSGRLHLVLLAGEDLDRSALEALDALAVLRRDQELLTRHFGLEGMSGERAPRLFVVSPNSDARLAERLAPLAEAGVVVLGLRALKSAAGERTYLVRYDSAPKAVVGSGGTGAFLRALPARLEQLGPLLIERMGRLDEELVASADENSIVWRLAGEVLCRVERVGDALQASVAPRHEVLPLGNESDLEKLLDRALARLVRVLGLGATERPVGPRPTPPADEPLLTPEEIQAFRE